MLGGCALTYKEGGFNKHIRVKLEHTLMLGGCALEYKEGGFNEHVRIKS
jgi:hypothetical protein